MAEVKKGEFYGWKDCFSISNGEVSVVITTEIGPRIISFSGYGKDNQFVVLPESKGKTGGDKYYNYGGHRVWFAPEIDGRTNRPDNSKCDYAVTKNGVIVMGRDETTHIAKGFDISMSDDGTVNVNNIIKNEGLFDVELSVWALSQFKNGGLMVVPNSTLDTGLVSNRCVSLWPYAKMNDKRVYWGDKYITVASDDKAQGAFKFGMTCDEKYACYFNDGQLFVKRFSHYYDADYPNYYCNFESYTNSEFIEIENLSPMFTLEAGEEEIMSETWRLYNDVDCPEKSDELQIENILKRYI